MAEINGLQLTTIPEDHYLTELENNLIARNLNFQFIYQKPKSRWAATKNQMISVPIAQDTVMNTVAQLPRLPKEAGLIPVQLKKKKEYKGCHRKELINPEKVIATLNFLKSSGHPYYQFTSDNLTSYQLRCQEQDQQGHQALFDSDEDTIDDSFEQNEDTIQDMETDEKGENQEVPTDVIRKYQFDHNNNTCLTHNYPEIAVDQNGKQII